MANISISVKKVLDKKFINAIKSRSFTVEQLDQYYGKLVEERKTAPIECGIACVCIVVGFYFIVGKMLNGLGDYLKLLLIILPIFMVLIYDYFFLRMNQFKSAVKKGYPELKGRYK